MSNSNDEKKYQKQIPKNQRKKIKILMFGWEFPPYNSGGLGVACKGLSEELSRLGVEIIFVLPKRFNLAVSYLRFIFAEDFGKFRTIFINSPLSPYISSNTYQKSAAIYQAKSTYGKNLFEEIYRYGQIARQIATQEEFDIIHAHDWLTFLAGIEAKNLSGKPLVIHIHATEFDRAGGENVNPQVYKIEKEGCQKADAIIAVSNFTKDKIIKYYGVGLEKIKVVYNAAGKCDYKMGLEISESVRRLKSLGKKIVIYVGRISLHKGPDYFLRAARRVLDFEPNVIFIMAGTGEMQYQVIELAASLGLSNNIIFTGFLKDEELAKIYQAADLYVMPSVSEPFGITALEALQAKTPILISRQSGVSEIISHALKVDFWDIDQMANKILAAINYPALWETLQENGSRDLTKTSWEKSAEQVFNIYNELLNRVTCNL